MALLWVAFQKLAALCPDLAGTLDEADYDDVAFVIPASPITGRGAAGRVDAGRGGSIGGCGGLSWSGGCCNEVVWSQPQLALGAGRRSSSKAAPT